MLHVTQHLCKGSGARIYFAYLVHDVIAERSLVHECTVEPVMVAQN